MRSSTRFERGMQWAIGDWYNAIPWGDKKAACGQAGLNYKVTSEYGRVAAAYQFPMRIGNCSFERHKSLTVQGLTDEQHADLLTQSNQEAWSNITLVRERDKLLGKPDRVPVENFNAQVEHVLGQLPASASKKVKRGVESVFERLKHEFQDAVEREVQKRLQPEKDRLLALEQEARAHGSAPG